jgi:hypothetical protein
MFQVFFTRLFDQDDKRVRFAVLSETTATSLDEIPSLDHVFAVTHILARNIDTGEKSFFSVRKEAFITPKATLEIRLIHLGGCSRCSDTGLYGGPTGVNMGAYIRGVKNRVLMPICFDCNGRGFTTDAAKRFLRQPA